MCDVSLKSWRIIPGISRHIRKKIGVWGTLMSKSGRGHARRIEIACVAVISVAMSGHAVSQEQQSQPSLPPIVVEQLSRRPESVIPQPDSNQRAKPRRARRTIHQRSTPASGMVDLAAQQAAAEAYGTREGSEAQGYKPSTVSNFGPFGQVPILDAPYSVNVISADMLKNIQASSTEDALRISPVVQVTIPANRITAPAAYGINLRGFLSQGTKINGLSMGSFSMVVPIEDKERIEIFTGLTGFLYGATDVGGVVNYVYKKPTPVPYYSVTLGDYGNTSGFVDLDAGGPIDKDGTFAYRLNVVGQDGKLPTDPQKMSRGLVTGVFDWNITSETKLELIASHQVQEMNVGAVWIPAFGGFQFDFKTVPDPSKFWGQLYTSEKYTTDYVETNFNSKINDIFSVRAAYSFKQTEQSPFTNIQNYWDDNKGAYEQYAFGVTNSHVATHSAYGYLDADFTTGFIQHKVTVGASGLQSLWRTGAANGNTTTSDVFYNINQGPTYTEDPNLQPLVPWFGQQVNSAEQKLSNVILGDYIKFDDHWSALLGVNYATVQEENYNNYTPPFELTSAIKQSRASPSYSLIYKPVSWISTYATYSESLEPGTFVPNLPFYTNAGSILPPYVGEEYELGVKANVGEVLLTAAWFNIDKANQFARTNPDGTFTYVSDGREVHRGIELTATGNIAAGLRILGGVTLMDATVEKTANPATDGKRPINVSNQMAKTTLECDLPFLHGLTLTGGVYYFGKQAANTINAVWLAPFVTEDIGLRYRTKLWSGQEAIFRLNVKNLTNHPYWMNTGFSGAPRTIAFSGQIKF